MGRSRNQGLEKIPGICFQFVKVIAVFSVVLNLTLTCTNYLHQIVCFNILVLYLCLPLLGIFSHAQSKCYIVITGHQITLYGWMMTLCLTENTNNNNKEFV